MNIQRSAHEDQITRIAKTVSDRFHVWLNSVREISNTAAEIARDAAYVTGGVFASLYHGDKPKDYDVCFRSQDHLYKFCKELEDPLSDRLRTTRSNLDRDTARLSTLMFQEKRVVIDGPVVEPRLRVRGHNASSITTTHEVTRVHFETESDDGSLPYIITPRALTFTGQGDPDLQVLLKFHGPERSVWSHFYFMHVCVSWQPDMPTVLSVDSIERDGEAVNALDLIANKRLIPRDSCRYPLDAIFSIEKFHTRGWTIDHMLLMRMIVQAEAVLRQSTIHAERYHESQSPES